MSKSAFVVDTPRNCYECPLSGNYIGEEDYYGICELQESLGDEEKLLTDEEYDYEGKKKPEWCPLVPIPEKTGKERLTADYEIATGSYLKNCMEDCQYDNEYCGTDECPVINAAINKLAEYERAEEQGLLLKLPCKEAYSQAGNTVYFIFEDEIVECMHCGLNISGIDGKGYITIAADEDIFQYRSANPEHDLDPTEWCKDTVDVNVDEIGRTLFFTRKEAEKKLKEMGYEVDRWKKN